MSRPRKPTKILELSGAFKKDPARGEARKNEPRPEGPLGDPPNGLDDSEAACWVELSSIATWLTEADRWIVELAACLMALKRDKGIGGRKGMSIGELNALTKCLTEMGLTSVARSKVSVPQQKEDDNPFAKLAKKVSGTAG